ncbi:hypothetical protein FANTH_6420 [Fusarium anthophilum]|uniref:Uncharacterized protein n=1 Tax=Fusarium anthophilum TaxID=48485 RepID=A0A8H4ZIV8_9HYPO|nr:hypothetical protein FANTH_6420 [Fusarium anthophilum]
MCSDFLADINNNHAKECRMNWGPKFVSGIKAITALGQLLLVARSELNVSTLEIPGSYDNRGKLLTIGEKVQSCSRLYLEAFAKSEQSLGKLSETAWELAHSRGSLHHVIELFRKDNSAIAYSSFRDEWARVHQYLNNLGQHASACFESWTYLLFVIQEFEAILNDMMTDNKKSSIRLTEKLEAAKGEIKTRRCDIKLESPDEKDTQRFDFTYAIPLLTAVLSVMFLSGIVFKVIIVSGMAILDDNDGDQARDLEIEIELLTQNHKLKATICQTLQEMGSSLASAIGGIRDTRDSYKAVFDRLSSMNEAKFYRFNRTMNEISCMVSYDESYPPNRTTDQRPRDSKDVKDLKEPAESNENPGTA